MEDRELTRELIESGDGSHTLRVPELKEHYHSHKGAIQESMHVFVKMGLHYRNDLKELRVFEVGFGTGLNALLTALDNADQMVHYTAIETYPLDTTITNKLNYAQLIGGGATDKVFEDLHQAPWGEKTRITSNFELEKVHSSLQEFGSADMFDLVYYDAFAPHAQPELWTPEIWQKLYRMMNTDAVLVTYCAKGQVRRDLESARFVVERLEGPPGKREMIRATKAT